MVNYKKLVSFDKDSLEILANQPEKKQSEFCRDAVKFYNANKEKTIDEIQTPKKIYLKNLEVKL